jgi:hypothetical protein
MKKVKSMSITDRWEMGIPHDPRSVEMYNALAKIDWEQGGDSMDLKSGGDGDNGENLMYLMDVYFEDR